jgi:hypothetical protein
MEERLDMAAQSQSCGTPESAAGEVQPSAAEAARYQRVLAEMVETYREMEERFAGYHRQMTQRGEASNWDERSDEDAERADALEWALAAISKAAGSGRSNPKGQSL